MNKQKIFKILFALSGVLPVLFFILPPHDPSLLIYSIFVLIYFSHHQLRPLIQAIKLPALLKFFILAIIFGLLTEALSWTSTLLSNPTNPDFTPHLALHLKYLSGFYIVKALAWVIILRFFKFSLKQVFITAGIFGIAIEQQGAILLTGLASFPLGIIWWIYTGPIYACVISIAYLLTESELHRPNLVDRRFKYPVALLTIFLVIVIFSLFDPFFKSIGWIQ